MDTLKPGYPVCFNPYPQSFAPEEACDCMMNPIEDLFMGSTPWNPPLIPPPHAVAPQPAATRVRPTSIQPQRQSNSKSCGQASVAMALTGLTGKAWSDEDVNRKYGFSLLSALNAETADKGLVWRDRSFSNKSWPIIEEKLKLGRPVLMGLNGPDFSPSGRGHIITVVGMKDDKVLFLDPATGKRRSLPKQNFEEAPPYPQGNFFFYASKER